MPYDLEFPTWILDQRNKTAALGQSLGRNMLEGMRLQDRRKMYEDQAPMREAELASALAQNTLQQQKIKANAFALGLEANAQAGMADALNLEADIASRANGWTDPETPIRVGRLIQQYPGLNETPWHKRINQSIQTAKDQDFKIQQLEQERRQQLEIQKIREAGDIGKANMDATARAASKKPTYEEAYQAAITSGKSPEEAHQEAAMSQAGGYKISQAAFTVDGLANTFDEVGIPYQPYEIRDAKARIVSGGVGAANVPAKMADQIQARYAISKNLGGVSEQIDAFEKKYGKGTFSKYVGPIDNGVFNLQTKAIPKENVAAVDEDARKIFQSVNFFIQEYRNQQFGASLTENETKLFERIVNNPNSAAFVNSVKTFEDLTRKGAGQLVSQNKWAANIPIEIKKEFLAPKGFVRKQVEQPQSSGQPVRVSSEEEYKQLPSGSLYIDDSGKTKRKR